MNEPLVNTPIFSFKGAPSMATHLRRSLLFVLSAALVSWSVVSHGQSREKFVISAKAGGINAVTGRAKVHLKGGSDWQQLTVTDDLEAGDVVRTEAGARVDMLLNPGSYLRLGESSEFELVNNSLDNLELKLLRGTAIVEATGADNIELLINITTPHAKLAIVRHGLYRLNVIPEDATELIVRKGRVMLNDSHTKVKGGNKVIFSATAGFSVAKLEGSEKKDRDDVDNWSKERAQTLAKANSRISERMLSSAFSSFNNSDWIFNSYRSPGFWFFNSRSQCYTFLPFSYGWGSPYGGSYSLAIYNPYYCCGGYSTRGIISTPSGSGSASGSGSGSGVGILRGGGGGGLSGGSGGSVSPAPAPIRDVESPGRGIGKPDITPDRGRPERP